MTTDVIRWVEPFAYSAGQPFRVFPLGEFKRGGRTLDLTPERLKQMAANYEAGHPRWRIPLYLGHPTEQQPDPPKAGNVKRLYFTDGEGLFAEPEYTEAGAQAVKAGEYQYASPGVLWALNGSEYADEHGAKVDNVIEHVALTNRPYFSSRTALFSASAEIMQQDEQARARRHNGYTKLRETMRQKFEELLGLFRDEDADGVPDAVQVPPVQAHAPVVAVAMSDMASATTTTGAAVSVTLTDIGNTITGSAADEFRDYDAAQRKAMAEAGEAMPDGSFPIHDKFDLKAAIAAMGRAGNPAAARAHIMKRAKMMDMMDMLPADWPGSTRKESDEMADNQKVETVVPAITPEQFSELKAKADQAEALTAQVNDLRTQAETFAAQLQAEKQARRKEQLLKQFEGFAADKPDTLADRVIALEGKAPDLAEYFVARIAHLEGLVQKAGLFNQVASERVEGRPDNFAAMIEQVLASDFGGDRTKYADAYRRAGEKHPDLARAYVAGTN